MAVDFTASYAARLMADGVPERDAKATACWMRHRVDGRRLAREQLTKAELLERAAGEACSFAFRLDVLAGLTPDEIANVVDADRIRNDFAALIAKIDALRASDASPVAVYFFDQEHPSWREVQQAREHVNTAWFAASDAFWSIAASTYHIRELACEMQRSALRINAFYKSKPSTSGGRPRHDRIKSMCEYARTLGLTASDLARVAVDNMDITNGFVKPRLNEAREDAIDRVRLQVQRHWPLPE